MIQMSLTEQFNSADNTQTPDIAPQRITEIILAPGLSNSFQLLLPMLGALIQEKRWLAWVNPPPALLQQWQALKNRNAMENIMIVRSRNADDAFELMQKALAAGTCHTVVAWTSALPARQMKMLENASAKGESQGILLRHH